MIRTLEIAWLCIATLGLATAFFQLMTEDLESALWMLFVTGVAAAMFFIRRKQRIRFQQKDEKELYH